MLFEVASSTLCSQQVVREPNMIPHLIFRTVLRVQASETNNWLDTKLILGFMSEPLNGSHSSIINSTASLLTEGVLEGSWKAFEWFSGLLLSQLYPNLYKSIPAALSSCSPSLLYPCGRVTVVDIQVSTLTQQALNHNQVTLTQSFW